MGDAKAHTSKQQEGINRGNDVLDSFKKKKVRDISDEETLCHSMYEVCQGLSVWMLSSAFCPDLCNCFTPGHRTTRASRWDVDYTLDENNHNLMSKYGGFRPL